MTTIPNWWCTSTRPPSIPFPVDNSMIIGATISFQRNIVLLQRTICFSLTAMMLKYRVSTIISLLYSCLLCESSYSDGRIAELPLGRHGQNIVRAAAADGEGEQAKRRRGRESEWVTSRESTQRVAAMLWHGTIRSSAGSSRSRAMAADGWLPICYADDDDAMLHN